MRTTFLGVKVPDVPKAIRCKVGDLVYATWYDDHEQEPLGGLGIVVEVIESTVAPTIKILHNGRRFACPSGGIYDPKEGKAYFEPSF